MHLVSLARLDGSAKLIELEAVTHDGVAYPLLRRPSAPSPIEKSNRPHAPREARPPSGGSVTMSSPKPWLLRHRSQCDMDFEQFLDGVIIRFLGHGEPSGSSQHHLKFKKSRPGTWSDARRSRKRSRS